MLSAGQRLRELRERLGLTIRDVENASAQIAARHKCDDFTIPLSRLSDIETKGVVPSIYRCYSLAVIYRCDLLELLSWYGIDMNAVPADLQVLEPPRSHRVEALKTVQRVNLPVKLDPSLDLQRTTNLGRMVERWGSVPLAYLEQFSNYDFTYGYVGSEDLTMYPLLLPGSFVQVDESKNQVAEGVWRSEYERPIYFVETRDGYVCSWCALKDDEIVLQPHPLSPVPTRMMRYPQDAEVLGQVVAIAMRLDPVKISAPAQRSRELPRLS